MQPAQATRHAPRAQPNALLAAALEYASNGLPVFPLRPRSKAPATANGFYDATTDQRRIRDWWRRAPNANIGIPTGAASQWLALDVDARHGGTLDDLADRFGPLPDTLLQQSGSGGWHVILQHPGGIVPGCKLDGHAYELKSDGGYIVVAPSIHPSGGVYQWLTSTPPAPMPGWLSRLLAERELAADKPSRPTRSGAPITPDDPAAHWLDWALRNSSAGVGDHCGYLLAQQLLVNAVRDPERTLLRYATAATLDPRNPFDAKSVRRWLRSAAKSRIVTSGEPAGRTSPKVAVPARTRPSRDDRADKRPIPLRPRQPNPPTDDPPTPPARSPSDDYHRTDLGNACRLVDRHGADLRHVATWGQWLVWDGTRWLRDETSEITRRAIETVKAMWPALADVADREEREAQFKWIIRSEGDARLKAMISLATAQPEVALAADAFDRDGWRLNCTNGTVNLRSGALVSHRQDDLCTKRATAAYDPHARCPRWLAFLETIFAGDAGMIAFVQRAVGYSLTANTSEHALFLLHGSGANGKSTFVETINRVLGDYATTTPMDTLMLKTGHSIPSDVARLQGARFVSASEAGDGRRLDEELVKRITGGDRMTARYMHHDWFEFTPVLKLWIAANHRPTVRGTDDGIWRRIRLIPFAVTIPPERQDPDLPRKLMDEAPGILAWAVQGCLRWQRQRLSPPATVLAATTEYRSDMDSIGRYLDERCVQSAGAQVTAREIYADYQQWAQDNGEFRASQTRFGAYLREHGCARQHTKSGIQWHGIALATSPIQGVLP